MWPEFFFGSVAGTLRGTIEGIEFKRHIVAKAGTVENYGIHAGGISQLKDRGIALWWPNGYGEPNLHKATFSFIPDGADEAMTSIEWLAGIRKSLTAT